MSPCPSETLPLYQRVQSNDIKHRQVSSDVTSTTIMSEGLPLQHGVVESRRTVTDDAQHKHSDGPPVRARNVA